MGKKKKLFIILLIILAVGFKFLTQWDLRISFPLNECDFKFGAEPYPGSLDLFTTERNVCLMNKAKEAKDTSICRGISSTLDHRHCIAGVAAAFKDPNICNQTKEEKDKSFNYPEMNYDSCIETVAVETGNKEICKLSKKRQSECIEIVKDVDMIRKDPGDETIHVIIPHNSDIFASIDGIPAHIHPIVTDTFHCHWDMFELYAPKGNHRLKVINTKNDQEIEKDFVVDKETWFYIHPAFTSSSPDNIEIEQKEVRCE